MGDPAGTASPHLHETRVPVWAAAGGALLLLSLLAGWLTSAASHLHHANFAAHLAEAGRLEEKGQHAEAAEEYRRSLQIDAQSFDARLGLARTLLQQGFWQEAAQHLSQLRRLEPTSGAVQLLSARASIAAGQMKAAADYYQGAVYGYWPPGRESERLNARTELVRHLARTKDQAGLVGELARLQSELPVDSRVRLEVARLYLEAGQAVDAAEAYRFYLASDRKNFVGWLGLGDAEMAAGRLADARRAYYMALSLRSNSEEAREKYTVVNAALNLDPMMRRLSRSEREARSERLVRLTGERLNACLATAPQAARGPIEKLLQAPLPKTVDERIDLAEDLWKACLQYCPPIPLGQSPLPLVFQSLSRGQQ